MNNVCFQIKILLLESDNNFLYGYIQSLLKLLGCAFLYILGLIITLSFVSNLAVNYFLCGLLTEISGPICDGLYSDGHIVPGLQYFLPIIT